LVSNTPTHFRGYKYKERERVASHSSQNELHVLAPFALPKMSCMLLFFPLSQRELNNSVACASGLRERRESLTGVWTTANMKGVKA
jgi:hypothetical protein